LMLMDSDRLPREFELQREKKEKEILKVSLTQSSLAFWKTSILAMNQHPRNGYRHI